MNLTPRSSGKPRGQMIVLFALMLTVLVLGVGLVVDGGNALMQRRASQNAADFGALAGARIVAFKVANDTVNGTDANVQTAITRAVLANGGTAPTYGAPNGPRYVDSTGALLGYVGSGMPATASGVKVGSGRSWTPYFLGIIGINNWTASADAVAKGGYCVGCAPLPGTLFPIGISKAFFDAYPYCGEKDVSTDPTSGCYPQHLTPGNLNVPGGFGWLKFGCDGYGLGQVPPANIGGCQNSKPFLQGEIGPPSKSYGCCTVTGVTGSLDQIGSLPGNKVSADCSYYIDNAITVTVPIWDTAGGNGSNGWYHIVGFAGFQITGCSGGKDVEGVWRKEFFTGPTTDTPPPGDNALLPLGVQLIH